jgi:hypothetical protein
VRERGRTYGDFVEELMDALLVGLDERVGGQHELLLLTEEHFVGQILNRLAQQHERPTPVGRHRHCCWEGEEGRASV